MANVNYFEVKIICNLLNATDSHVARVCFDIVGWMTGMIAGLLKSLCIKI